MIIQRSWLKFHIIILNAEFSRPIKFSFGTKTFSKITKAVPAAPEYDVFILEVVTPSLRSMIKKDNPLCLVLAVRTAVTKTSAT